MEILIIVGCLLIGIIFIGLSIYSFVKEIKEKDSKKDKWIVVAQNILGLFSHALQGGARLFFNWCALFCSGAFISLYGNGMG